MDKTQMMEILIDRINELNYHYYTLDQPLLSDREYDEIYDQLKELEAETGKVLPNSPTQKVGGEILEGFKKHEHLGLLWSLDKSQSFDELRAWDRRVKKAIKDYNLEHEEELPDPHYILEYKFDGLTINLTYEGGQLIQAATRGNGRVGEGILAQVKTIKSIPKTIEYKGLLEVQGEGLMPLSALEKYNETAEEPLKNARNAAAGALRNLDTNVTKTRNLTGYFYNVGYSRDKVFRDHIEMLDFLKENYIPVYPYLKDYEDIEDLILEIQRQDQERKTLDVLTDGMVIKLRDIKTREVLGYTNKFPRWAIAYKFEAEEITTKLLDVVWNVGRTGKVTPSAVLEAVEIGGATIRRATLNNIDDIERKGVKLNSRILLRRSNDVIPEILGIVDDSGEDVREIEIPSKCPACGTELIRDGVHIFCLNSLSCNPQLVARLVHFASRDAMNIEGFSEKTAELLLRELDIKELPDLYKISYDDLIGLEGFKDKKTKNLLEALEKSKDVGLAAFIYALGIKNVGIKTATDLADYYKNFESLREAKFEELINIGEIGEVIAQDIVEFFRDDHIKESIDKLLDLGIKPYYEDKIISEESIFTGKTVVITGTIEGLKRSDIKRQIELLGGKVTGSVSKNTDFLIAGESAGSKYDKALELGTEIIDEARLKSIFNI